MPAIVACAAVTKTRSRALSPATSGTGYSRDCTAWVRYTMEALVLAQEEIHHL